MKKKRKIGDEGLAVSFHLFPIDSSRSRQRERRRGECTLNIREISLAAAGLSTTNISFGNTYRLGERRRLGESLKLLSRTPRLDRNSSDILYTPHYPNGVQAHMQTRTQTHTTSESEGVEGSFRRDARTCGRGMPLHNHLCHSRWYEHPSIVPSMFDRIGCKYYSANRICFAAQMGIRSFL